MAAPNWETDVREHTGFILRIWYHPKYGQHGSSPWSAMMKGEGGAHHLLYAHALKFILTSLPPHISPLSCLSLTSLPPSQKLKMVVVSPPLRILAHNSFSFAVLGMELTASHGALPCSHFYFLRQGVTESLKCPNWA